MILRENNSLGHWDNRSIQNKIIHTDSPLIITAMWLVMLIKQSIFAVCYLQWHYSAFVEAH